MVGLSDGLEDGLVVGLIDGIELRDGVALGACEGLFDFFATGMSLGCNDLGYFEGLPFLEFDAAYTDNSTTSLFSIFSLSFSVSLNITFSSMVIIRSPCPDVGCYHVNCSLVVRNTHTNTITF